MDEVISALLVHDQAHHLLPVRQVLRVRRIELVEVRSCQEAATEIARAVPPHLVFTDVSLPDGTCLDIIRLARQASLRVNVIVASRIAELGLYLEATEQGAFDFVDGSCVISDLVYVVQHAAENAMELRSRVGRLHAELEERSSPEKPMRGGCSI